VGWLGLLKICLGLEDSLYKKMAGLTIENLIKMIIAVVVIVVIVVAVYFVMSNYIIPYFSDLGFEEPKIDPTTDFAKELLEEKNIIGSVSDGIFIYEGKETDIYFKSGQIFMKKDGWFNLDWTGKDLKIGNLDSEGKIVISNEVPGTETLSNAYKYGNEIYKIA